jgi:predicted RNA methylase
MQSDMETKTSPMDAMSAPFEPRRFRSTVPFYGHRAPYPQSLISFVAECCCLKRGDPVLDLGCGPGMLATAFARLGCTATAMDPEPAMLAFAAEHAAAQGMAIKLIEGSSYDLGRDHGPFRLVVMGRSFHWMNRETTLRVLDDIIEATGAVAFFGDRRVATPGADWPSLLHNLGMEFAPVQMARTRRKDVTWKTNEANLLRSPVCTSHTAWHDRLS